MGSSPNEDGLPGLNIATQGLQGLQGVNVSPSGHKVPPSWPALSAGISEVFGAGDASAARAYFVSAVQRYSSRVEDLRQSPGCTKGGAHCASRTFRLCMSIVTRFLTYDLTHKSN